MIGRFDLKMAEALRQQLDEESRCLSKRGAVARRAEIKASGDFHLLLASMSGNAILHRFMEELVARSSLVIALYGRPGTSSCGHGEHLAMVDAMERGNEHAAEDMMLHHIEADLDLQARGVTRLKDALLR